MAWAAMGSKVFGDSVVSEEQYAKKYSSTLWTDERGVTSMETREMHLYMNLEPILSTARSGDKSIRSRREHWLKKSEPTLVTPVKWVREAD